MEDCSLSNCESEASDFDTAMKPVKMPLPKATAQPGVRVDPDRALTTEDIMNPARPSMDGAPRDVVVDNMSAVVDTLFKDILIRRLEAIKRELAKAPPVPNTPLALTIIGALAEVIASQAIGVIGGLVAQAVGARVKGGEAPIKEGSKTIGKSAGEYAKKRVAAREAASEGEPTLKPTLTPSGTVLDEYIERCTSRLYAKRIHAIATLRLIRASATKNTTELARLDEQLSEMIDSEALGSWFKHKVTMEYMNLCARLSLGSPASGQATSMPGANISGGLAESGVSASKAWSGAHEGFIDVVVSVAGGAPSFARASLSGGPGMLGIMRDASVDLDDNGQPYTLATLPVFRRVFLKYGDGPLSLSPAFVITPEGAIEANFDNAVLASLGGGPALSEGDEALAGRGPLVDPERKDAFATVARRAFAAQAMTGAHRVVAVLRTKNSEVLR